MSSPDAAQVLEDLPASLWGPLLHAVRKATDRLGRSQLPGVLQPYAGFTPARLGQGRARRAVITSLIDDARLREAAGRSMGNDLWQHALAAPAPELVEELGVGRAVALLVCRERWADAAAAAERVRAGEEHRPARATANHAGPPAPAKATDAALRRERDAAQRRAEAAEQRVAALQSERCVLQERVSTAEVERAAAERRYDEERSRSRDRMARLQRRISDAEARSRADAAKLEALAGELERLAGGSARRCRVGRSLGARAFVAAGTVGRSAVGAHRVARTAVRPAAGNRGKPTGGWERCSASPASRSSWTATTSRRTSVASPSPGCQSSGRGSHSCWPAQPLDATCG